MTLSRTSEYALRTLTFMSQDVEKMYSAGVLHRHLKIPRKYLQRLLTKLSKSGLITSARGRRGGYMFARSIRKIYLCEVIEAVEGFDESSRCFFGFEKCPVNNPCAMHDLWSGTQNAFVKALSSTTLWDVVKKR